MFKYVTESRTGLKRSLNEDSVGTHKIDDGLLIIVCDGLGGNNAGDIASNLTVRTIFNYFKNSSQSDYLERIKSALELANSELRNYAYNNPEVRGMGTTAEVIYLGQSNIYWGHVGDSRIYLFSNGTLRQLTKDHSLVQKLVDDGRLTLKEAEKHPNRNIITKALGKSPIVDTDLSKARINTGFKFFICTDGVNSVVSDEELTEILKQDFELSAPSLVKLIENRGAPDNYSFVIVET